MTISNNTVEAVLQAVDVEGLIARGAPADEYFPEAKEITTALSKLPANELTEANVTAVIALVWTKYFGLSSQDVGKRMPAFQQVAHQLV